MWFLTSEQCQEWIKGNGLKQNKRGALIGHAVKKAVREVVPFPEKAESMAWFSRTLAETLRAPFGVADETLLWVRNPLIWSSSSDWNLYYRLRQAHGDRRPWHEAPGHVFLPHEAADLGSFLLLAVTFGWDALLVGHGNDLTADMSHGGFVDLYGPADRVKEAVVALTPGGAKA